MSQDQRFDPHEIYYGVDGERLGPVDLDRLRQLIEIGKLRAHDYIWLTREELWVEAAELPEIAALFGVDQLNAEASSAHSRWGVELPYAGFWIRLAAHLVDALVLLLPWLLWFTAALSLTGIDPELIDSESLLRDPLSSGNDALRAQLVRFELLAWGGFWVIDWIYRASLESSPWQATVGKRIFGLVVTDLRGYRLSPARAAFRHVCKLLSMIPFNFGFLVIAVHEKKQGLHDLIAHTLVIRR